MPTAPSWTISEARYETTSDISRLPKRKPGLVILLRRRTTTNTPNTTTDRCLKTETGHRRRSWPWASNSQIGPPTDCLQPHDFMGSAQGRCSTVARSVPCLLLHERGASGPDAPQRHATLCTLSGLTQGRTTAHVRRRGLQRSARVVPNRHYICDALRAAPGVRSGRVAIVANLLRPVRSGINDARRGVLRQCRTGRF